MEAEIGERVQCRRPLPVGSSGKVLDVNASYFQRALISGLMMKVAGEVCISVCHELVSEFDIFLIISPQEIRETGGERILVTGELDKHFLFRVGISMKV